MDVYNFYITPDEYKIAERNGISRHTLDMRIRELAWDKQRAITEGPQQKNDRTEFVKIAQANGIEPRLFYNRVSRGMNPHRAATQPKQCKKTWHKEMDKRRRANFRHPVWVYEEIKKIGVTASLFQRRLDSGNFTFEEAYTMPPLSGEECARRAHESRRAKRTI